jgi:hypothetical protein
MTYLVNTQLQCAKKGGTSAVKLTTRKMLPCMEFQNDIIGRLIHNTTFLYEQCLDPIQSPPSSSNYIMFPNTYHIYKKCTTAAPRPSSAPTAAVCFGAPPAEAAGEDWLPPVAAAEGAAPATDLEGVGRPDVKGALETDEAPEKAGAPAAAEGLAMVLFMGFRTLGEY